MKNDFKVNASELIEAGLLDAPVTYDWGCDCQVRAISTEHGIEWDGNECWQVHQIEVDEFYACKEQYGEIEFFGKYGGISMLLVVTDDTDDGDFLARVHTLLSISDDQDNPGHADDVRAELITDYLDDNNFFCWLDREKGFANEYTVCISQDENPEDVLELESITTSEAGKLLAYTGDATTKAYNKVVVI